MEWSVSGVTTQYATGACHSGTKGMTRHPLHFIPVTLIFFSLPADPPFLKCTVCIIEFFGSRVAISPFLSHSVVLCGVRVAL